MSITDLIQESIAVLIDGDNISPSNIQVIFDEIAIYGKATIRRVYGDWTSISMTPWKNIMHRHAIQPIQQFAYTTGKNATDSALIIDAMDILHNELVDSFCIVSSDSDYTRLATRIREEGLTVYGIGEEKTPVSFRNACNKFIFIENLRETREELPKEDILDLLKSVVNTVSDEEGWAYLSQVGIIIREKRPDFDHRTYGYGKLSDMFKNLDIFEVRNIKIGPQGQQYPEIRIKVLNH
jgi:hypothetical protein